MNRYSVTLALLFLLFSASRVSAGPVHAGYDPGTGEIWVSITDVVNWYVEHEGFASMTGDAPQGLPAAYGLITDNDIRIGQSGFAQFSYDLSLGNVAAANIPFDNNLKIFWNDALGSPLKSYVINPGCPSCPPPEPPVADILGPITVNLISDPLNIVLDASGSTDDGFLGPLGYFWDLDGNGSFEVNTGLDSTLEIADVTSTFGGVGSYPVSVLVYDGIDSDVATTTVVLVVPEPVALVLVVMGVLGLSCCRGRWSLH